jgi:hypothetical protein
MTDETKPTVDYTVQMERMVATVETIPNDDPTGTSGARIGQQFSAWQDIATVTVPVGSKRKTVLREGLKQSGLKPPEDGTAPRLRVLDAESAEVHEPPMEWKL